MFKYLASMTCGLVLLVGSAGTHPRTASKSSIPIAYRGVAQDSETETVLSTMRCKSGKEDELRKTLAQEWTTLRKLSLVLADPHVLLKGKDDSGKPIFVEVFTWRDHDAPDHVPPEVQTIWTHMQSLVEARDGHKGIEFPEFEIVN